MKSARSGEKMFVSYSVNIRNANVSEAFVVLLFSRGDKSALKNIQPKHITTYPKSKKNGGKSA